jgi:23S rRNA pseudouridine955/2504/2580 synthase
MRFMKNSTNEIKVQLLTIDEGSEGQRIDNFLLKILKGVPKTHIYKLLRKGEVRVNKKRIKANYKLELEDIVRVPPVRYEQASKPSVNLNKVKALEACIIHETNNIIVLNKPSGIAVHGGSGVSFGVIEALRQLRPEARFLELVHRIDKDTSGCLLIAKKRSCLRYIHSQLREKKLIKKYQALVVGKWPRRKNAINLPLFKYSLPSGERLVKVDEEGKRSVTKFAILDSVAGATLLEASPITGRTHQIRVHCQAAGHSIIGDSKYCDQETNKLFAEQGIDRLMLHAHSIEFSEKEGEPALKITAPWPKEIKQRLDRL